MALWLVASLRRFRARRARLPALGSAYPLPPPALSCSAALPLGPARAARICPPPTSLPAPRGYAPGSAQQRADTSHANYRRLLDSRSALSWASILSESNSIAAETPSAVGGAGIGSPPTCCAPGWPSATSKDALVWIGAPRRLTNGKTR